MPSVKTREFQVVAAREADVYRDFARIHESARKDGRGRPMLEGTIARVRVHGGKRALVILRGDEEGKGLVPPRIRIDDATRQKLGLAKGITVSLELSKPRILGTWRWAWSATDPAYRVAARLAFISLVLGLLVGILGLVLGIIPFFMR